MPERHFTYHVTIVLVLYNNLYKIMKQILNFIKHLPAPVIILVLSIVTLPAMVAGFFLVTYEEVPYASELAFIEYSSDRSVLGSVVPASCASGYEHAPNDCLPPAPTVNFIATVNPINPGDSSVLSWSTTNTTACTASGGWGGARALSDTEPVSPAVTTTYTLLCSGPGGTAPAASVTIVVNPPVVTFTATPALIGLGDSSTLDWTVVGATACTASDGWSGSKSTNSDTEPVSPSVTTSYTLTCSGPSGTTPATATVTMPSGFIATTPTPCVIPPEGTSCNTNVVWEAYNFLSTPSVQQQGVEFSTLTANPGSGLIRSASPSSSVFRLEDTGSAFYASFNADVQCAANSVWAGGRCITLPDIDITADPNVIRSGTTAPLSIEIDAGYELVCTLSDGGSPQTFTHTGVPAAQSYNRTTRPLSSAQIVSVSCVSPVYPPVNGSSDVRVNVVPTIQEI